MSLRVRFGDFELDVAAYELRRGGRPIRLERQPMDLLIMLVERRGLLVSRGEIVDKLWGKDVFVDVETGVHTAIRKIRQALRDSADEPVFIETVSGKGYRFVAPVEVVGELPPVATDPPTAPAAAPARARIGLALLAVAAVAGVIAWGVAGRDRAPSGVRLAVLPFENLSGDPDRDYLADGLTEETIASLGQVDPDRVSVVGRTSVMTYRGTAKSLAEIGRELNADYLLESSIRGESGRLRITAKLIRVRDQVQVWSQLYNREPTSMLGLQQELSAGIAEQIRFTLSPDRVEALARREPRNAAAYDLYLRGLTFARQRTPATNLQAIEHYKRATQLDPDYALAWSALAEIYAASPLNGDVPALAVTPGALEAARRAVSLAPGLAEVQFAMGYANWILQWDWPAAEAGLRRAIDLDRRSERAHTVLGHALSQMGRHAEALAATRRAREIDPLSALTYALSSQVAFQARDYTAAFDHASQAIALDKQFWIGHMMRGQALEQMGQYEPALEALAIAARFSGNNSKPVGLRGYVLGKAGRREEARQVLGELEALSRKRFVPPFAMALVHAGLGERDLVFEWLDRAFEVHDIHLIYLTVDPKWDPYRSDPRFEALLARCGFTGSAKVQAEPQSAPKSLEMGGAKSVTRFFVTSRGLGRGGDLGGLAGADAHCQALAKAEGAGDHTWRAYLSVSARDGQPAVNARDRIGTGPWYNAEGLLIAADVGDLHLGKADISKQTAVTERLDQVNGVNDSPNQHDILTGSRPDGTAFSGTDDLTCGNWTSSGSGRAQVGHHDRQGAGTGVNSWNSVHPSRGCSQDDLRVTGGAGLFYCFAID